MSTQRLTGQTILMDGDETTVRYGVIELATDDQGHSEVSIRNDEAGETERIEFVGGDQWIVVQRIIQAIRANHPTADLSKQV